MSLVVRVPETAASATPIPQPEIGAWQALRRHGVARLLKSSFMRFRYGDGFSHARALGLQLALATVPLVIAVVGLSRTIGPQRFGEVMRDTVLALVPDGGGGLRRTLDQASAGHGDEIALWLGMLFAIVSLTTAMGQIERGANRIYGIERDRPSVAKYGRAVLMNLIVGIPAMVGIMILLGAAAFSDAVERVYRVNHDLVAAVGLPTGALLVLAAASVVFKMAPRRKQPPAPWLALGAVVSLTLWAAVTVAFAAYLQLSSTFTTIYGPLTAAMAVLLWAELTAIALLFGLACAAQLEAVRAGVTDGAPEDPE